MLLRSMRLSARKKCAFAAAALALRRVYNQHAGERKVVLSEREERIYRCKESGVKKPYSGAWRYVRGESARCYEPYSECRSMDMVLKLRVPRVQESSGATEITEP